MKFKSVKGTRDILPGESNKWQFIENLIRDVLQLYRYQEIRTPIFEETVVFARGIGEETDIVGKEMYTFLDKGGTSLTLRPEMTAPVIRSYIQHSLHEVSGIHKLYYFGPMFRQERPQAGRYRQFHQYGFESIGLIAPACDAEIIAIAADIYNQLGISYKLKINSVGDPESRTRYREVLQKYLTSVFDRLTPDSQRRTATNPLRVLDSKAEQDFEATKDAPSIFDSLTSESKQHFDEVLQLLDSMNIMYQVDPRLVRGLDYYSKTAFEFISDELGAQDALGGGGRYDGLAEQLGGKPTPAVGYAAGFERLLLVLEKKDFVFPEEKPDVYFIALDDNSRRWCFLEAMEFRKKGIMVECDYAGRSMKAQMREANKLGAKRVVIVGEEEMNSERAIVKNMETGEQTVFPFTELLYQFISAKNSFQSHRQEQ